MVQSRPSSYVKAAVCMNFKQENHASTSNSYSNVTSNN